MGKLFEFEFAYSGGMQLILFFVSLITTFIFYYATTDIVLTIYGEKAGVLRKTVYTLLVGTGLNTFWIYIIYYIGGKANFSPEIYSLVTIPNPVFALIYYYLGVKVLKLQPHRSVRLLANTYLFIMAIKMFQRIVGSYIFAQKDGSVWGDWNYLLDAASLVAFTFFYLIIFFISKKHIVKSRFLIPYTDRVQSRPIWAEILWLFIKTALLYSFIVLYGKYANIDEKLYIIILFLAAAAFLYINLSSDARRGMRAEIQNKAAYIKSLNDTIDDFSGMRHDVNNILQSYEGYIESEDIEKLKKYHSSLFDTTVMFNQQAHINKNFRDNPAIFVLLMGKMKSAENSDIKMRINLLCDTGEQFIPNIELCRIIGGVLDGALAAAAETVKKRVSVVFEEGEKGSLLIVIDYSAAENPEKKQAGAAWDSLRRARKSVNRFPNVSLQTTYHDGEITVYINLTKAAD